MRCVVPTCDIDSIRNRREIKFFIFPSDPSLREAWLEALHMKGWEPEECSVVCSQHFLKEDVLENINSQPELRAGAVPVGTVWMCRICFGTDGKLYPMTENNILYKAYETLTGLLLKNEDKLPRCLCMECAHRLVNGAHFRARSVRAHMFLLELVKKHGCVTLQSIQSIIGLQNLLGSNLTDSQIHQNDFEMKLLEAKHVNTDEQADQRRLPSLNKNSVVIGIIEENDNVINQDILKKDITNGIAVDKPSLLTEQVIKAKNNMINQNTVYEHNILTFKLERDNVIDQDIFNEDTANGVTVKSDNTIENIIHNDTLIDGVKIKYNDDKFANHILAESSNSMKYQKAMGWEVDACNPGCYQTNTSVYNANVRRPKTAAERMREYRARKRSINQYASDISSIVHNGHGKITVGDNDNINITPELAEPENLMKCQNAIVVEVGVNDSQSQTNTSVLNTSTKRPKTAAERMREYRARKRNKIRTAIDVSSVVQRDNDNVMVEANSNDKNKPSFTDPENSMKYRNSVLTEVDVRDRHCFKTNTSVLNTKVKRPKTAVERMREYRAKKRNYNQDMIADSSSTHHQDDNTMVYNIKYASKFAEPGSENSTKAMKGDVNNRYCSRTSTSVLNTKAKRHKTVVECMQEHRTRKRNKQTVTDISPIIHHKDDNIPVEGNDNIKNVSVTSDTGGSLKYPNTVVLEIDIHDRHCSQTNASIQNTNTRRPKTTVKRMREYRA